MGMQAVIAGGLAAAAGLALVRWLQFERFLRSEEDAVRAAAERPPDRSTLEELTRGLPPPVRRFFQRSMEGDCSQWRLWVARGAGCMRFEPGGTWKALRSQTVGAVGPEPGFVYTGTVQLGLGSLLPCRGREALLRGRGAMVWRLWGVVPLACSEGGHLDQSALLRWLAEAVCFPPALLPSPYLRWLPAGEGEGGGPDHSARAVLSCRGVTAEALCTFDGEGRFIELVSEHYWRVLPGGGVVRSPWRARSAGGHTRFSLAGGSGAHSSSGGSCSVEIPTQLEAAWVEEDGSEFVHIQFTVNSLQAG